MSFTAPPDCRRGSAKSIDTTGTLLYNVKVNQGKERSKFPACVYFTYNIMGNFQLLTLKDVTRITAISKSKIYRDVKTGDFPSPLRLGGNCVRWNSNDVFSWIEKLN